MLMLIVLKVVSFIESFAFMADSLEVIQKRFFDIIIVLLATFNIVFALI